MSDDIKEPTVAMRYALTRIKALEAQFAQAMELLEDVPGEVLLDRVNRIAEWHHSLGEAFYEMRDEKEALETELTAAREALEKSREHIAGYDDDAASVALAEHIDSILAETALGKDTQ